MIPTHTLVSDLLFTAMFVGIMGWTAKSASATASLAEPAH